MSSSKHECDCQFCFKFADPPISSNRILWESNNFIILPSIGSFTPGYLLLMPRSHVPSFAALTPARLRTGWRIAEKMRQQIEDRYGPCIIAEHGPGPTGTMGAACCAHAHWHFIPCNPHQVSSAYEVAGGLPTDLTTIEQLRDWRGSAYMFLSPLKNVYWTWPHSASFPPQFVRRVCAKILGCADFYNWALYPYRENMLQTRTTLTLNIRDVVGSEPNGGLASGQPADLKPSA